MRACAASGSRHGLHPVPPQWTRCSQSANSGDCACVVNTLRRTWASALAGEPDEAGLLRAGVAHVLLAEPEGVDVLLFLRQAPALRQ